MSKTTLFSAAALTLVMGLPAVAQTGQPSQGADLEQVRERLGDAGIEERRDFGGKLVRATTEAGETVFMLVSPRDLGSDAEIALGDDELRDRFKEAGFTSIEVVEEADFVLGDLDDDMTVIVMRGQDISDPMATGTVAPLPDLGASPAIDSTAPGVAQDPATRMTPSIDVPSTPGGSGATPRTAPQ